jgi:hypothetical protein
MRASRKPLAGRGRLAAAAATMGEQIDAAAHGIFERHPGLCGFTLRFEGDAILADVSLSPYAAPPESLELFDDIAETMLAFVDEDARLAPLLARRTFARTRH